MKEPSFTLGIEEEYHLVDKQSRDVVVEPPPEILEQCKAGAGDGLVAPELLRSQIEIGTGVCKNIAQAREELAALRRLVVEVAGQYNLAPIAASTHPFAHWQKQRHTDKERYNMLYHDMQALAHRLLICGMHVHVGIDDDELRIALMNHFSYYLPLLLALSSSSPFWEGENTGLKSFRTTVFDNFPRTGLPEKYENYSAYEKEVAVMTKAGIIKDATLIWWDLRPSARFPTLEMRITDLCTRIDDAISLAALTQSLLRWLYRQLKKGIELPIYPRLLVDQNRWRAIRYGFDEGLIDLSDGEIRPIENWLERIGEDVYEDAVALQCANEFEHAMNIPKTGTSAHRQIEAYDQAKSEGADGEQALYTVVDMLIDETRGDTYKGV